MTDHKCAVCPRSAAREMTDGTRASMQFHDSFCGQVDEMQSAPCAVFVLTSRIARMPLAASSAAAP